MIACGGYGQPCCAAGVGLGPCASGFRCSYTGTPQECPSSAICVVNGTGCGAYGLACCTAAGQPVGAADEDAAGFCAINGQPARCRLGKCTTCPP